MNKDKFIISFDRRDYGLVINQYIGEPPVYEIGIQIGENTTIASDDHGQKMADYNKLLREREVYYVSDALLLSWNEYLCDEGHTIENKLYDALRAGISLERSEFRVVDGFKKSEDNKFVKCKLAIPAIADKFDINNRFSRLQRMVEIHSLDGEDEFFTANALMGEIGELSGERKKAKYYERLDSFKEFHDKLVEMGGAKEFKSASIGEAGDVLFFYLQWLNKMGINFSEVVLDQMNKLDQQNLQVEDKPFKK